MKTASCQCGALSAKTRVEPTGIVACHCSGCQRRTGSVFGVGAYYLEADVEGGNSLLPAHSHRQSIPRALLPEMRYNPLLVV